MAVENVKSGCMTLYRVAKLYKIPKATLFKHVKGIRGVKSETLVRPAAVPFHEAKKIADCIKLMEKWGFGLSKKEVLETIGRYVNESKIPIPFRGLGVPGDDFFIRFKRTHKPSLKKPQSVEASRKRVIYPVIISEEVITSGEVRERIKETVSKTCERQEQTRIKKTKKKEESGDSEQLKPQAAI